MSAAVDPEVLRAAIGQAVTVVGPDEVLAILVAPDIGRDALARLQEAAEDACELYGVRIVFICGDDWAKIRRDQVPGGETGGVSDDPGSVAEPQRPA